MADRLHARAHKMKYALIPSYLAGKKGSSSPFAANRRPSPPPPPLPLPLPLPPGHHRLQRHHRGQTRRRKLLKKEATAAAPPAYQRQHQRENVYKSRRLGLINLSTVFEVCDDGRGNIAISKL
jgi:hypothetical protein